MHSFTILTPITFLRKLTTTALLVSVSLFGLAQNSTSHSPYSQFGIGQMRGDYSPQMRSMGNISSGIRYINGLPVLNITNPASYSALQRTILEGAVYGNITQLSKGSISDHTADFAFSQILIGLPLAKAGGLAIGLTPYSDVGFSNSANRNLDSIQYKMTFSGEGGLNKAFVGYGVSPFKGLSVGANLGYIFGHLSDISSMEFPLRFGAYNSVLTEKRQIGGVTVDYGLQYFKPIGGNKHVTIGYSGSLNNTIKNTSSRLISRNNPMSSMGSSIVAMDTTSFDTRPSRKINLPLKHNLGISLAKGYNWMVGADFKYADWSDFQTRAGEKQMGKDYGFSIGGQIKPDPTSIRYFNQVDYRLGFRYNRTPIKLNNTDINDMAISVGLGLPLPETNFGRTFSVINLSAEFGQLGTLSNNLVRERYINFNIGFTLNDSWFIRRHYD